MLRFLFVAMTTVHFSFAFAQNKRYVPTDGAGTENAPKAYANTPKYKKIVTTTQYLTMRDGVKIAVNVALPKGLKEGEKIPAVIYQTRYWRGAKFNWPFSMFLNNFSGETGKFIKSVLLNGYALVAVDSRGSGASMGTRPHPWTEDETKDGYEIVDWVVSQSWCSGKVGSAGISYSGTTAEFLATTQHPAVKAVVPMFSLYDVYDDISVPGGAQLYYFTSKWGAANQLLDKNKLPVKSALAKMVVGGVQPVKGERKMVKEAIKAHQANLNVNDGVRSILFRDDISKNDGVTSPDKFSPHVLSKKIDEAGVAVYGMSGYYDGNYQHAAVKRHLTLTNSQNKLILGPWEHGGWMNCSPHNPGKSAFDKGAEIQKFFDYHLKGIQNGIYDEARVHYYTLAEEKWKSSDVWPPAGFTETSFFLAPGGKLDRFVTKNTDTYTTHKVDSNFTSSEYARWITLMGELKNPPAYADWNGRSVALPQFTLPVFDADVEFTGHGVANLYISTDKTDGVAFVYVEDVAPDGTATYVTEGQLRMLQRAIGDKKDAPHNDAPNVPYHSFLAKDGMPMTPGKVELISFDLFPVSYLFKKGHALRISISGADRKHFKNVQADAEWKIHHSSQYPSAVVLPIK